MTDVPVVRLTTPEGIAAAIPHMLGFVPSESLVVVCLHGQPQRLGLTMRLDLDDPALDKPIAAEMADRLTEAGMDSCVVAVFTDEPTVDLEMPRSQLVRELEGAAPVRDALLIRNGRCWSYSCINPDCCPAEGKPINGPEADALAAAHAVANGRSVLRDREQTVASVAAPTDDEWIATVFVSFLAAADYGDDSQAEQLRNLRILLDRVLPRFADPRAELTAVEVGALTWFTADTTGRDHLLLRLADESDVVTRMLFDAVRKTPAPIDPAICSAYAFAAYLDGDGIRAQAAITRALESAPDYKLALMLDSAIGAMVPPSMIREVLEAVVAEARTA